MAQLLLVKKAKENVSSVNNIIDVVPDSHVFDDNELNLYTVTSYSGTPADVLEEMRNMVELKEAEMGKEIVCKYKCSYNAGKIEVNC